MRFSPLSIDPALNAGTSPSIMSALDADISPLIAVSTIAILSICTAIRIIAEWKFSPMHGGFLVRPLLRELAWNSSDAVRASGPHP